MTMMMTSSKHVRNIPISSCDNACSIRVFSIEFKQFLLMHTEEGHRIHDVDVDADVGVHLDIHDLLIASRTFQASPLTLTFFFFFFCSFSCSNLRCNCSRRSFSASLSTYADADVEVGVVLLSDVLAASSL